VGKVGRKLDVERFALDLPQYIGACLPEASIGFRLGQPGRPRCEGMIDFCRRKGVDLLPDTVERMVHGATGMGLPGPNAAATATCQATSQADRLPAGMWQQHKGRSKVYTLRVLPSFSVGNGRRCRYAARQGNVGAPAG
jgi:hypothetical protein